MDLTQSLLQFLASMEEGRGVKGSRTGREERFVAHLVVGESVSSADGLANL